jgi:hypothetical protein
MNGNNAVGAPLTSPVSLPVLPGPRRPARAVATFFAASFVAIFGAFAVGWPLNVDENVFVVSAAIVARNLGMLYRDFHYNHLPTLVLVYALLFRHTDYLLLAARTFCALCAAGTLTLLFREAWRAFAAFDETHRKWLIAGATALIASNPIFTRTAGRAWNHDFPMLLSLAAYLIMSRALRSSRPAAGLVLAGLLVGLAVTSRLTFATLLLPLGLFILIFPHQSLIRRLGLAAIFSAGFLFACIPTVWIWAQSPGNAYFGNFQYPALNTLFHFQNDTHWITHGVSLLSRLFFLFNINWQPPMWGNGVLLGISAFLVAGAFAPRKVFSDELQCELFILIVTVATCLATGLVPAPSFHQYFYPAYPFMLLAALRCVPLQSERIQSRAFLKPVAILVGITAAFGLAEYRDIYKLAWVPRWEPVVVHRRGVEVARFAGDRTVLTLDPIFPMEGGANIYMQSATGPFGLRVGQYLPEARLAEYRMWGPSDLTAVFSEPSKPAFFIAVSRDQQLEKQFIGLANSFNYSTTHFDGGVVWLPPIAAPQTAAAR